MPDKEENWEFGIREEGHTAAEETSSGDVILGENGFRYQLSGTDWGNIPDGWTYKEATAVDVDSKDRVYVFGGVYAHLTEVDLESSSAESKYNICTGFITLPIRQLSHKFDFQIP